MTQWRYCHMSLRHPVLAPAAAPSTGVFDRRSAVVEMSPWTIDKTTATQYVRRDGNFEWDDAKAASNVLDHGITFEMARKAFKDAFSVDWIDDRQDTTEERLNMLGMVGARIPHVSYTIRGQFTRIISARKAEPHERRRYHNENREF